MVAPWEDHCRQHFLIFVSKNLKKNAILSPKKPKNCKRFVDDVFVTIQKSFFNTKIYFNSGFIASKMHLKVTKLAPRQSSSIPKRQKQNALYGDLRSAELIPSNFNNKKMLIHQKFYSAGYPSSCTDSAIRDYYKRAE